MAKMVSLGRRYDGPEASGTSEESFPSIYLEGKQIEALGLDTARVGSELTMVAKVRVASLSQYKGGEGSMSIEVIEAMMKPVDPDTDAASVLFPNEGK